MAQGGSLKFVVEVAADNATKTLQSIQTAVDQAGVKMKTTMLGMGDGSRAAAEGNRGLEASIKALKGEMASGDRTINFFARSLNNIVPESTAAGQAVRLFADGLIGGIGLGFALQGIMALLTLFGESLKASSEAEKKAAEESQKYAEARYEAYEEADKKWRKLKFINAGGTAEGFEASENTGAARGRVFGAEDALTRAQEKFRADWASSVPDRGTMQWDQYKADLAEIQRLEAELFRAREAAGKTVAVGVAVTDKVNGEKLEKNKEFWRDFNRQVEDAQRDIREKERKDLAEQMRVATQVLESGDAQRAAQSKARAWMPENVGGPGGIDKALGIASKNSGASLSKEIGAESDAAKKSLQELQRQMESVASAAERIGSAIGSALTSGMKPMQKVLAITKEVLSAILQMAIKQITANAFVTGSEEAKAVAGTPFIGPILAPAAMAGGIAMIMGLLGSIPSAAGGMKVPEDTLAFIHKDEHVIPARIARQYEKGAAGGGVTLNVTMQSSMVDTRGMERALTRYDGGLQRGMRKLQRQRRA